MITIVNKIQLYEAMDCSICHNPIPDSSRGPIRNTCSSACKQKYYRLNKQNRTVTLLTLPNVQVNRNTPLYAPSGGSYEATNIVILREPDRIDNPNFDWELSQSLADKYTRPVEWIKRSIRACREAGESPQYFIDRYLIKTGIEMNQSVDQEFRTILDEMK